MIIPSLLIVAHLTDGGSTAAVQPSLATNQSSQARFEQFPGAPEREIPAEMTQAEGEIIVTATRAPSRGDPIQSLNRTSFEVVRAVDTAVTGPVARGYKTILPSPIRDGVRNALRNLGEPVVIVNYLLQLKPKKSVETFGRLAINSTIGLAGLFDVAKKPAFGLPYHANGLAHTLGYYGVKPGPYMYLPLIGPTTVRDLAGRVGDMSLLPVAVGRPFSDPVFAGPATVIRLVDERAEADDLIRKNATENADPYAATRARYLKQRQAEIDALRGRDEHE